MFVFIDKYCDDSGIKRTTLKGWINRHLQRGAPLTSEERNYLLEDIPTFEECHRTREELAAMTDAELMNTAYSVWVDYCR